MTSFQINDLEQKELEELVLLLENRTFVDYFNTFLCLPVFGQHVFYNYFDGEFDFEPPIKIRRYLYLDHREVLKWLCTERFRLFKKCPLYTEFKLCMNLRDEEIELAGFEHSDDTGQASRTFLRNIVGNATGMLLFRESLRGTCGEHVYRCWKDIEAWKLLTDPVKKTYWKHIINTQYISQNSTSEIASNMKLIVYNGFLNFDLLPDDPIHLDTMQSFHDKAEHFSGESDIALLQLQAVLLEALRSYWLPRHLLHIMKITSKETIEQLTKAAPGDSEHLIRERRLRCHLMFPASQQVQNLALNSSMTPSMTPVHTSKSASDALAEPELIASFVRRSNSIPVSSLAADRSGSTSRQIQAKDLLALWGGATREIEIDEESEISSISLEKHSSLDVCGAKSLNSAIISPTKTLLSPIPAVLSSYLGGKNRALVGKAPETTKRVIWCLASDVLASCPFRSFLAKYGHTFDVMYLNFWTDVRNYLDTDEHSVDGFGQSLRQMIAQRITEVYLSSHGEGSAIFSEHLKMSLYRALTTNNDASLLCVAQNMVQQSLWQPLKAFIHDERKRFIRQVMGRRIDINFKTRRAIDQATKTSRSGSAIFDTNADPLNFFKCKTVQSLSDTQQSPQPFPASRPDTPMMSRPGTSFQVCNAEQRPWKAMEIAVLCCEYGSSMMVPQYLPTLEHLVEVVYSDDGSLHRGRTPAVRNEWLRSLLKKPKFNIETLRVSRNMLYERPAIRSQRFEEDGEMRVRVCTRARMGRRAGLELERPSKPKSFVEILTNPHQFEFFKRFMIDQKMAIPLRFWTAVDDFKATPNPKVRQIRIRQILRKFFGKFAKYGEVLECHEEIIQQIPNMEKVTPGILFCAQAAVARTIERRWFPTYLETFPPDSTEPTEGSQRGSPGPGPSPVNAPDLGLQLFDKALYGKRRRGHRSRAAIQMWKKLARKLVDFIKAISSKTTIQLFEMFLKFEVEREKFNPPKEQDPKKAGQIEKKMMMSSIDSAEQTRMVVRNRLITMNRVPSDLRFWVEIKRYQDLVDLVDKSHLQGPYCDQFTEILRDKAIAVTACFLDSDIKPKVQVNISNDLAAYIIQDLSITGPGRGLFHDAKLLLFPILFHFYQRFNDIWMSGDIPDDYMDSIEHALFDQVATTPHCDSPVPDLLAVNKAKISNPGLAEDMMGIHFSLSDGLRLVYPVIKVQKPETNLPEKRATKTKLLPYEVAAQGDNKEKDGRMTAKAGKRGLQGKTERRKAKMKLVVKEQGSPERPSRRSLEKARKLNLLVETINREKEAKIKEQNKQFSKVMNLKELVNAALTDLPYEEETGVLSAATDILPVVNEGSSVAEL